MVETRKLEKKEHKKDTTATGGKWFEEEEGKHMWSTAVEPAKRRYGKHQFAESFGKTV